jgi:hypothetical protein
MGIIGRSDGRSRVRCAGGVFSCGANAMDDMQFLLSKLRAFQSYQESVLVKFDNHVWSIEEFVGLLGA